MVAVSGMAVVKPLLAAANGQSPSRRPVWFMRQAGRSLPEYRALRADRGMLEACFDPAMVCEITMQPVRRHDTDGAILFSDIVVPLKAAGIDLDIVAGTGPVIAHPVRTAADVEAIGRLDPEAVGAIGRAVALLRAELDPTPTALIGFAIEKAGVLCKEKGFKTVALSVAAAFHSHLMKDAQKPFMDIVQKTNMTPTDIPVYANSSGTPYPTNPEDAKKILGEQLLRHVDFVNDIKNLYASGVKTFVEVGPKTVLTGLIKAILSETPFNVIPMDGSGGKQSNTLDLALAISELAALGYPVILKNWESNGTPPSDPKKPKMEIMISGANYRASQATNRKREPKKT